MPLKLQYTVHGLCTVSYHLAPKLYEEEVGTCSNKRMTPEEVSSLSKRIHSAKQATVTKQSATARKQATSKRKRPGSKVKKRARKKRAPSTKPKKCSVCLETKPSEEYLSAQRRKTSEAKCTDCVVDVSKVDMAAYNEPMSWSRPADEVQDKRAEVRCLRSLGCERYECPILFANKANNMSRDLHVSFFRAVPDASNLVGMYDIVFVYSDSGAADDLRFRYKQRTARGQLTLISQHLPGIGRVGLYGIVEMDPLLLNFVEPRGGSISFSQTVNEEPSRLDFELPIAVVDYPDAAEDLRSAGTSTGTISVLSQRTATGWNPKENEFEDPWGKSWEGRVVSFDTVEEAEELVKRWEASFLANSGITNHLPLPPELALKIHEYVAFRPSPAFFFEKGDLWINMKWPKAGDTAVMKTLLVARRRNS